MTFKISKNCKSKVGYTSCYMGFYGSFPYASSDGYWDLHSQLKHLTTSDKLCGMELSDSDTASIEDRHINIVNCIRIIHTFSNSRDFESRHSREKFLFYYLFIELKAGHETVAIVPFSPIGEIRITTTNLKPQSTAPNL